MVAVPVVLTPAREGGLMKYDTMVVAAHRDNAESRVGGTRAATLTVRIG